jgi:hypothetical protein
MSIEFWSPSDLSADTALRCTGFACQLSFPIISLRGNRVLVKVLPALVISAVEGPAVTWSFPVPEMAKKSPLFTEITRVGIRKSDQ